MLVDAVQGGSAALEDRPRGGDQPHDYGLFILHHFIIAVEQRQSLPQNSDIYIKITDGG